MDSLEGMSDLFVKVWPEGCDAQETDTHWRCKKGESRISFDSFPLLIVIDDCRQSIIQLANVVRC
jgi:hypothetical protein